MFSLTIQNTQNDDIFTIEVDENEPVEAIKLFICAEKNIEVDQ
jgi:hypothetical protein